jgi:hypothetical protein
MRHLLSPILAVTLTAASAAAMTVAFVAGFEGWTVMASGLALTAGALWLYSNFEASASNRWN